MTIQPPTFPSKPRRSLRDTLRNILWKGRRQRPEDVSNTVGSGILRRDPSLVAVRAPSEFSPDLCMNERFDVDWDEYCIPDRFNVSSVATAISMGQCLRPQMSMSSFDTYRSSFQYKPLLEQRPVERSVPNYHVTSSPVPVPSILGSGASYQASLITIPSLRPSTSTLRIRRSDQSLRTTPPQTVPALRPNQRLIHKKSSIGRVRALATIEEKAGVQNPIDQRSNKSKSMTSSVRFMGTPPLPGSPSLVSDSSNGLTSVSHFSSFCVLDTATAGCPVTATSKELRYIFEIGEQFCLNNRGCEGTSMDMITGEDAAGNPITHLVLFSPLVIPSSGRSRFMLASLVDVTDFIQDTASLPELSTISEDSFEDDLPTPIHRSRMSPSVSGSPDSAGKRIRYELSAESLLGGCFVAEPKLPTMHKDDDIWLNLATEERRQFPGSKRAGTRTPMSHASSLSSVDDVLDEFMNNLQEIYSDFFLLAKSPLDDSYYEICNVSPRVFASKDYVHGHLSMTPHKEMIDLSTRLVYDEPFTMLVRWGTRGEMKQLYCVPLFARVSTTWVCFLVDPSLPPLWL